MQSELHTGTGWALGDRIKLCTDALQSRTQTARGKPDTQLIAQLIIINEKSLSEALVNKYTTTASHSCRHLKPCSLNPTDKLELHKYLKDNSTKLKILSWYTHPQFDLCL